MRIEREAGDIGEHVEVAVVVQDARPVDVGARGDEQGGRGRGAVMPAAGEGMLCGQGSILDVGVDVQARESQEIGEQIVVVRCGACRPAGLQ